MQIAVNTRLLLAHRMEGVARYIYETSKEMVLSHPEVQFHFLFDRPYDEQFIFADNVIPHVIGWPSRHPLLWYLWFERSLPKFLRNNNIDVLYSGDMYMSLHANIPTLMVSHDLNYLHYPEGLRWSHLKFYQKYMPLYHKAADHLITVSEATKKDVIEKYNVKEDNITVAYNSVPSGFEMMTKEEIADVRMKFTKGCPYLVYVGSLHPRKNVERLLLAYDRYKSADDNADNIQLVIYGRKAWKTDAIFSIYNQMKYKEDVVFLSNEDATVHKITGAATAMCYVSLFEGFGIPILEAYKCGVPVITSNVSSMPEVAGEGALIVDPKNIASIAEGMSTIVNDESLRRDLIQKGQKQLELFSWKKSADTIFEKLQKLAR